MIYHQYRMFRKMLRRSRIFRFASMVMFALRQPKQDGWLWGEGWWNRIKSSWPASYYRYEDGQCKRNGEL